MYREIEVILFKISLRIIELLPACTVPLGPRLRGVCATLEPFHKFLQREIETHPAKLWFSSGLGFNRYIPDFGKVAVVAVSNGNRVGLLLLYPIKAKFSHTVLTDTFVGLGSNPGEGMDVCKCIVPSRHGSTLNSRRTTNPLLRLVEEEEMWEAPNHPHGVFPQNWSGKSQIVLSPTRC
ncbi:uncharacterized protein TNCV_495211 [Trichonephila clavipes]|nr:uncharacterized protein TNCV_495211 [Trichonephila clavipes]